MEGAGSWDALEWTNIEVVSLDLDRFLGLSSLHLPSFALTSYVYCFWVSAVVQVIFFLTWHVGIPP